MNLGQNKVSMGKAFIYLPKIVSHQVWYKKKWEFS